MSVSDPIIRPEKAGDAAAIDALEAKLIGPGRFARTAYRVREGASEEAVFAFVALIDERIVGSIRFTPVSVGGRGGVVLLGPLLVVPELKGRGVGMKLIETGVGAARKAGNRLVLLVGDLAYYARAGFERVPPGQITLPGPIDANRLLARALEEGALGEFAGLVCS